MTFTDYLKNAQSIFGSFLNEAVGAQGGVKPNRQIENPEAGYCDECCKAWEIGCSS
jgi:hypothetical protein